MYNVKEKVTQAINNVPGKINYFRGRTFFHWVLALKSIMANQSNVSTDAVVYCGKGLDDFHTGWVFSWYKIIWGHSIRTFVSLKNYLPDYYMFSYFKFKS